MALCALLAAAILADSFLPPVSTIMMARWARGAPVERDYTALPAIAPALVAAVIASEDARFCRNHGVDWGALREVVSHEGPEGPSRGASTITMQTVKNLFLWPSRSALRKAFEIPLSLGLGTVWSKRRVLETYLNIAEWGDGIFGVEAAARRYFGKSAAALSAQEGALLATALPNPVARDAGHPGALQRRLAARLMQRVARFPPNLACVTP